VGETQFEGEKKTRFTSQEKRRKKRGERKKKKKKKKKNLKLIGSFAKYSTL